MKKVPVAAVIYVINISEEMERLRESSNTLQKLLNEPTLQTEEGLIIAIVYNNKPLESGFGDNHVECALG